jgi:hypothetical protein
MVCLRSERGQDLTANLLQEPKIIMLGALPPIPYTFIAWCLIKYRKDFAVVINLHLLKTIRGDILVGYYKEINEGITVVVVKLNTAIYSI